MTSILNEERLLRWWRVVLAATGIGLFAVHLPYFLNFGYSRDFSVFYTAVNILRHGAGHQLYDLATQLKYCPIPELFLPFIHPAFEALFFLPFGFLVYPQAYLLWTAVNLVWVVWGAFFLAEMTGKKYFPGSLMAGRSEWQGFVLYFFAFYPTWYVILNGQDSLLFFLTVCGVWRLRMEGKFFYAGLLAGIGCFKPQLMVPLAAGLAVVSPRAFLYGFLGSFAFVNFLFVMITGPGGYFQMHQLIQDTSREAVRYGYYYENMANVRGILERYFPVFGKDLKDGFSVMFWFLNLGLTACLGLRFKKKLDLHFLLAVWIILALFASYPLNYHDMILLMIPVLFSGLKGVEHLRGGSGARRPEVLAQLSGGLAVFFVVYFFSPLHLLLNDPDVLIGAEGGLLFLLFLLFRPSVSTVPGATH